MIAGHSPDRDTPLARAEESTMRIAAAAGSTFKVPGFKNSNIIYSGTIPVRIVESN